MSPVRRWCRRCGHRCFRSHDPDPVTLSRGFGRSNWTSNLAITPHQASASGFPSQHLGLGPGKRGFPRNLPTRTSANETPPCITDEGTTGRDVSTQVAAGRTRSKGWEAEPDELADYVDRRLGKTRPRGGELAPWVRDWLRLDWLDDAEEPRWFREMWIAVSGQLQAEAERA